MKKYLYLHETSMHLRSQQTDFQNNFNLFTN